MTPTATELLQRMPIFGALRADSLRRLLERSSLARRARGDYFFAEGDAADSMFVIESGRVAVVKRWNGHELQLQALAAGDCFGEMALMDLCPRSAAVRAETDCQAIEIGVGNLLVLAENDMEQFALLQMNLGREVCRRLRATDELLFRARVGELPVLLPGAALGTG